LSHIFRVGLALLALLVSACATVPPAPGALAQQEAAYDSRAAGITAWTRWGFHGRLSMDDGVDGGSGRLDWRADGDSSRLDFRGTLGRGAWRLTIRPKGALLQRSDGSRVAAPSVEELVLAEVGWRVPVDALAWWVRGLRAPGEADRVEFDESGRIVRLLQAGWTIEFDRYRAVAGTELPGRIEAVSGDLRLKLVPAQWSTPVTADDSHA
jgi:outer membrane lipoprotein LolB